MELLQAARAQQIGRIYQKLLAVTVSPHFVPPMRQNVRRYSRLVFFVAKDAPLALFVQRSSWSFENRHLLFTRKAPGIVRALAIL
jgi:hypothetical protein